MKIALLGFGLEAQSAYNFLKKKYSEAIFKIYDQKDKSKVALPKDAETFLGVKDFLSVDADLIVRTPAVNPSKLPKNIKTTSVTSLFFEYCPAKIIGVTGSKGKGTTSSFIAEILKSAGIKTHLVGNIGVPALDKIDEISADDAVVYEMSSFQLWDMQKSPHISILNNIEPDHLDVHDSFDDYVMAKMNIATHQTEEDFFIYNSENKIVCEYVEKCKDNINSTVQKFPDAKLFSIKGDSFALNGEEIFEASTVKLPGVHNQKNALAAMTATYDFLNNRGFELEEMKHAWQEGLSKFDGLPHRLRFVKEINGIKFYDDSIATTPGSAIAAMNSFSEPKILILGGSNKGADLTELIEKIANSNPEDLKQVVLIGAEAEKLNAKLIQEGFDRITNLGLNTDMDEIVKVCMSAATAGDVVVLSPAHASFDMFKSYSDRGEKFIESIEKIC